MQAQSGKMASSSSFRMFSCQCCSHLQTKQANSLNLKESLSNSPSTVPYQRGRTMKRDHLVCSLSVRDLAVPYQRGMTMKRHVMLTKGAVYISCSPLPTGN